MQEAPTAAKNCGDGMCLLPALCLKGLVKGITNLRCAAFAVCVAWQFDPIRGVCSAWIQRVSGKGSKWEKRPFDQSSCNLVAWWPL